MTQQQLVRDWMTDNVITANLKDTLIEVDAQMREYGVRRLPVLDTHNKLVGIVTKGDVREASPSNATTLSIWEVNYLISKLQIKSVMTTNPLTISADADIIDAAQLMLDRKVSGLPVVGEKGELVGIITESDIFRMLVKTRLGVQDTLG